VRNLVGAGLPWLPGTFLWAWRRGAGDRTESPPPNISPMKRARLQPEVTPSRTQPRANQAEQLHPAQQRLIFGLVGGVDRRPVRRASSDGRVGTGHGFSPVHAATAMVARTRRLVSPLKPSSAPKRNLRHSPRLLPLVQRLDHCRTASPSPSRAPTTELAAKAPTASQ